MTEIEKNNKLIAEFMAKGLPKNFPRLDEYYGKEELKFHNSWDWLMPVVEKIQMTERVDGFTIETNCIEVQAEPEYYYVEMIFEGQTLIDSVYRAVVEFIKWYNEQT